MATSCYECGYKGDTPGSAHIRCKHNWQKSGLSVPKGNPHGIRRGWWMFPVSFDPVWMLEPCPAFAAEGQKDMILEKADPFSELIGIFASAGR